MIYLGIIGLGKSAINIHLPAWKMIKGVKVISLYDIDKNKRLKISKKFNIPYIKNNELDFFSDLKIDAIQICSPNHLHYQHIISALFNSKHVICEKPFVLTQVEINKIIEITKKNKLICTCSTMQRFRKPSLLLKNRISRKSFGKIYHADIKVLFNRSKTINYSHFVNNKYPGSGLIYDIGSHFIDLAWFFMNCPIPKSLSCKGTNKLSIYLKKNQNIKNKIFNINDFVTGIIKFKNGSTISFQFSYLLNTSKTLKRIDLYSNTSHITWPDLKVTNLRNNKLLNYKIKYKEKSKASIIQLQNFKNAINGKKNFIIPMNQLSLITLILEKLNRSEYSDKEICL